jgi:hypothetical protein
LFWSFIAISALSIALAMCFLFRCVPVSLAWNILPPNPVGHCMNAQVLSYVAGGFNISTDLLLLILPFKLVKGRIHLFQSPGFAHIIRFESISKAVY